jgi:hypothetical protein
MPKMSIDSLNYDECPNCGMPENIVSKCNRDGRDTVRFYECGSHSDISGITKEKYLQVSKACLRVEELLIENKQLRNQRLEGGLHAPR